METQTLDCHRTKIKEFLLAHQESFLTIHFTPTDHQWIIPDPKCIETIPPFQRNQLCLPEYDVFLYTLQLLFQLESPVSTLSLTIVGPYHAIARPEWVACVATIPNIRELSINAVSSDRADGAVNILGSNENKSEFGILGTILIKDTPFERLVLHGNWYDEDIGVLARGLHENTNLKKLVLSPDGTIRFGAGLLELFHAVAGERSPLESFHFRPCYGLICWSIPFCFSVLFERNNRLVEVSLDVSAIHSELHSHRMEQWAKAISKNNTLKTLALRGPHFSFHVPNPGWECFFTDGLRVNTSIKELRLDRISLNNTHVRALCGCIRDNQTLQSLSFHGAIMNDEHVAMLMESLVHDRSVEELAVAGGETECVHFGAKSHQALALLLQHNEVLKKLTLAIDGDSWNVGVIDTSFIRSLRTNRVLEKLYVNNLVIDSHPKAIEELASAMRHNTTLTRLSFHQCFGSLSSIEPLIDSLGYNRAIQEINISPLPCFVFDDEREFTSQLDHKLCDLLRAGKNHRLTGTCGGMRYLRDKHYQRSTPYLIRNKTCAKNQGLLTRWFWMSNRNKGLFGPCSPAIDSAACSLRHPGQPDS